MTLNLTRWREALLRLERRLKELKMERRRHREPGTPFDSTELLRCKAEATRLYCVRRFAKGKLHTIGNLRRVRGRHTDVLRVEDLATQEALLRSEPGWLEAWLPSDLVESPLK